MTFDMNVNNNMGGASYKVNNNFGGGVNMQVNSNMNANMGMNSNMGMNNNMGGMNNGFGGMNNGMNNNMGGMNNNMNNNAAASQPVSNKRPLKCTVCKDNFLMTGAFRDSNPPQCQFCYCTIQYRVSAAVWYQCWTNGA